MSKVRKIFWLVLIIVAIGIVAVFTRTPNRGSPTAGQAAPGGSEAPAEVGASDRTGDAVDDATADSPNPDRDGPGGAQNSSQ